MAEQEECGHEAAVILCCVSQFDEGVIGALAACCAFLEVECSAFKFCQPDDFAAQARAVNLQEEVRVRSCLIWTIPGDSHGRAVEWALRRRDVNVGVWIGPDFPATSTAALRISNNESRGEVRLSGASATIGKADVVWRRRQGAPMFHASLQAADKVVAINESEKFISNMSVLLDRGALLSVNSEVGAQNARNKALQLELAVGVGMRVPETVMTNDPVEVEELYRACGGRLIIKSFTCPTWKASEAAYFAYSRQIDERFVKSHQSIRLAPSIYQELIVKSHEVRIFFAGRSHFAVQLSSQVDSRSVNDWRALRTVNIPMQPVVVPEVVVEQCLELMSRLGIVTGSFDFAVTPEGDYVFFEINEQGQFLWT